MGQSFFIWNGVDCRSMGCRLKSAMPIIRPEERVEHVQIPGRSGDLTQVEGENIYNSYIQTASVTVEGWQNVRRVYGWLRGSGYLTTSSEPDRRQPARIIGAVTLDRISRNLDKWTGEVQFYCQPLKELLQEARDTSNEPFYVINRGDVIEKPIYKVTIMSPTEETVLSVSHSAGETSSYEAIAITAADSPIYIDSELQTVYNSAHQDLTHLASGVFPVLRPGRNQINGQWWIGVEVIRRERFL